MGGHASESTLEVFRKGSLGSAVETADGYQSCALLLLWEQSLRTALKGLCVVDQSSGGRRLPPIMPNHSALYYTLTQTMRKRNVRQSRIVTLGVLSTEELTAGEQSYA